LRRYDNVVVILDLEYVEGVVMNHNREVWWQQGVIYQVYLRSFKDTNGDGIGDLRGIISQLEYLIWLGVNAIWISPFYPSPMADFGYDIANFTDIDPIFGDLTTFDELVKQCHQYDLKVIIDFVPNHTSDEHPWFLDSRSSRNNSKRDWYIWADAKPDGSPPNNWLSVFGGSAWEWDETTGQYYLHSFHKKQPDLNWRNEALKSAMFGVVHFWLERGVDGLRVDAAEFIMKDPQLHDNPLNPSQKRTYHKSLGAYDSQIHLCDKGHPDIHSIYRELRSLLDSYNTQSHRMAIGEIRFFDWKEWASYYGTNLDELHMLYNFDLLGAAWKAQAIHQIVDALEASLLPGAWPGYALSNHDDPRIASRLGQVQARAAMLLLLTLRCTPTIYYGDEIGMHNVRIPSERVKDPWEKSMPGLGLGRDPQRTPMQWDSSPNTGFCPPTTTSWLPIADDYKQINVAIEREDPHSILSLTRALIQLRQATPALKIGSFHPIADVPDDCYAYLRRFDRQRYIICLNFSGDEQIVRLPEPGSGHIAISTYLDREETIDLTSFYLRGHEGCIIKLKE
jgi:alpha-glucosidase